MSTLHRTNGQGREHSVGELVARASAQMSQLVRDEMQLARAEMAEKGKRVGLGSGLIATAAATALLAAATAVAAAVAGLATVWPVWLSALVVAAALLALAGLLALTGRQQVRHAAPAKPERALRGVHDDFEEIRGRARR